MGFGGGGLLLGVIILLMMVSLGLRIFGFSRRRRFYYGAGRQPRGPEQLLARRFAAGEIDEDEYRRRLAALRNTSGPIS
jgi:putative membrane protein